MENSPLSLVLVESSVQFSRSVVSDSLQPHESHARPPCPSPTPRIHSNSKDNFNLKFSAHKTV